MQFRATAALVGVILLVPSFCQAESYTDYLIGEYDSALASEIRDADWAGPIESRVGVLLADAGFNEATVICGSQICRVSVAFMDSGPGQSTFSDVMMSAVLMGESVSIGVNDGLVVYVAREGVSLPPIDDTTFTGVLSSTPIVDHGRPEPYKKKSPPTETQ